MQALYNLFSVWQDLYVNFLVPGTGKVSKRCYLYHSASYPIHSGLYRIPPRAAKVVDPLRNLRGRVVQELLTVKTKLLDSVPP